MDQIRSVLLVGERKLELRKFDKVPPPPDGLLVRMEMCGVCGTDIHYWKRPQQVHRIPFPMGHEAVHRIEEFGPNACRLDIDGQPIKEGDRIIALGWVGCGECIPCRVHHERMFCIGSPFKKEPQTVSPHPLPPTAGFADYSYVHGRAWVWRVPDSLPSKIAVLTDPLSTAMNARMYATKPTLVAAVQGSGPIGILALFSLKLAGVKKVIMIGGPENRLKLCEEFGADHIINIFKVQNPDERVKIVKELTPAGIGPDIVIEAAGVHPAFNEALNMARPGGTVVEMGFFVDAGSTQINPSTQILRKGLHVHGVFVWADGPHQYGDALHLLDAYQDIYPLHKIVTHEYKLEEIQRAFEDCEKGIPMKAVIIP
jgi:threonine dehydrogenase-like Zn-dependent dehydrogenase